MRHLGSYLLTWLLLAAPGGAATPPGDRAWGSGRMGNAGPSCAVATPIGRGTTELRNQTNCGGPDTIQTYGGLACNLEGILYPGPERVYSIVLADDNRLGFELDLEGSQGDLMLALIRDCGDGSSCVAASPDLIGPGEGPEVIPAVPRPAGLYYLHVDSFLPVGEEGSCGSYDLAITGEGVAESVDLELAQRANADPVTAGSSHRNLVITLSVTNRGPNDATNIEVLSELEELPAHVRLDAVEPDRGTFSESVWRIDRLDVGQRATLTLTLTVGPSAQPAEGAIRHRAHVRRADQFRLNDGDDSSTRRVSIRRQVSLEASFPEPPPAVAVAGESFSVTAQWFNNGPSDASGVVARLQLDPGFTVERVQCDLEPDTPTSPRVDLGELPAGQGRHCTFTVHVDSSVREGTTRLRTETESQVPPATASRELALTVRRRVSLEASFPEPPPAEATAGEGFDVRARWRNGGPSDASEVVATLQLDRGLTLDPATCESAPEIPTSTHLELGELPAGTEEERELAVHVCPSVRERRTLRTEVSSQEPPATESARTVFTVEAEAELEVEVTAAPDPATAGKKLVYSLTLSNLGPSDATGIVIRDTLPDGVCLQPVEGRCGAGGGVVRFHLDALAAGESTVEGRIPVFVDPSTRGELSNRVTVTSKENPTGVSDSLPTPPTPVMADVSFEPAKAAWPNPAAPGDLLLYRLEAHNAGSSDALDVTVSDHLPDEVSLVAASVGCSASDESQEVVCDLDPSGGMDVLATGDTARRGIVVRVQDGLAEGSELLNAATFENREDGTGAEEQSVEVMTAVGQSADGPVLLLPFAHFDPMDPMDWRTTYLALQRLAPPAPGPPQPMPLPVEIELFNPGDQEPFCVLAEALDQGQVVLLDLAAEVADRCDSPGMGGVGLARIRATTEDLHGAFFEVDAAGGRAIGSTLVRSRSALSRGTVKPLSDLCPYWDHQVMVEDGWDTKIRFYLPKVPEPAEVQGTFYDATGQGRVRVIPVALPGRVVEIDAAKDAGLHADGTVEWDLGTVGHVSVVYQNAEGADPAWAVGMPAFCQTLVSFADTAGGPPFVVPSFVAEEGEGEGAQETTLFSLHNGTDLPVEVNVAVQDPDDSPTLPAPDDEWVPLAPHATQIRDLRDLLTPPERREGYVAITAREPWSGALTDAIQVLDGEILHLGDASASGERLVTSPGDLCRRWALFLIQDHPADLENLFDNGTEYLSYLPALPGPNPDPAVVEVRVYNQEGDCVLDDCETVPISIPGHSFQVSAAEILTLLPDEALDPELTLGAVEIAFPEGTVGHVSSVFRSSAGYAVETRGFCLEP